MCVLHYWLSHVVESSADWSSSSRDHRATAANKTGSEDEDNDNDNDNDDNEDDGEELLRRVLIAGGLRPSSGRNFYIVLITE